MSELRQALAQPHAPPDYRKCEFCGCETNGKIRACCNAGRGTDRKKAAASAKQPATRALDVWKCDCCGGDGWHWTIQEGCEPRDKVSAKAHCDHCDGLGWCGPDAVVAAKKPAANGLHADVLRCQVGSLRDALVKVLDTREKEAKAMLSWQSASDNYASGASPEGREHLAAMTSASNAEKEARLLLATLKAPAANETGEQQ